MIWGWEGGSFEEVRPTEIFLSKEPPKEINTSVLKGLEIDPTEKDEYKAIIK